jgi:hypothetical protein
VKTPLVVLRLPVDTALPPSTVYVPVVAVGVGDIVIVAEPLVALAHGVTATRELDTPVVGQTEPTAKLSGKAWVYPKLTPAGEAGAVVV